MFLELMRPKHVSLYTRARVDLIDDRTVAQYDIYVITCIITIWKELILQMMVMMTMAKR